MIAIYGRSAEFFELELILLKMKKQFLYREIKNNVGIIKRHVVAGVSVMIAITMSVLCFGMMVCESMVKAESYGKKVYPAGGATYVSSDFKTPSRPTHNGIDILRGDGKIYAVDAGTIVLAEEGCPHDSPSMSCECNGGCGNHVEILHEDGYKTKYLHMKDNLLVKTGDKVTKGQHIGMMGSTGRSSAVHLHFSVVNPAGTYIPPDDYLGGEFAELPPQNVKVRLSKDILQPHQPMIITYTATRAEFYIVHFYDGDGNLLKTINSQNEVSEKSITISFGTPGQYFLRVDVYNETGKAQSEKMSFQVFEGAIDLAETSNGMLKKAKKTNRGKKRSLKVKKYDLHIIEKIAVETTPQPEVYATPSLPPKEDVENKSSGEQELQASAKANKEHKEDKKVVKSKEKSVYKKKGFEYRIIKKGTAVKIVRYLGKSKTVNIPEKLGGLPVKVIGRDTFVDENGTTKAKNKIIISRNVEKFEKGMQLPAAKSYKVDTLNVNYSSENGVLYNEKKTALLRYPVLNTKSDKKRVKKNVYELREDIKTIGRQAFKGATFSGYVLPEGLKKINLRAFENNAKLATIKIPKSVSFIGADAFSGSYELKRVDLYSKKMPNIRLNSAAFASAKVFVPKGKAVKTYKDLGNGGYTVNERKGD